MGLAATGRVALRPKAPASAHAITSPSCQS
jgi:hypothetical protein